MSNCRLTMIKPRVSQTKSRNWRSLYLCECGNIKEIKDSYVRNGHTKSCGCLSRELTSIRNKTDLKHGMTKKRVYRIWAGMKSRCKDTMGSKAHIYANKGIKVCEHWEEFENFLEDMGEPKAGHSLDRIDGSKGYSPDNCKWSTIFEQNSNKSNNRLLTINGRTEILAVWCREFGIGKSTVMRRKKKGWSDFDAVTIPPRAKRRNK